jgi:hypothetical protein
VDAAAQVDVDAGAVVEGRPGHRQREDRAAHDDEMIDAGVDEPCRDVRDHLRGESRPWRQLVAGQPQTEDRVGADGATHGFDDPVREQPSIRTPLVVALVGQAGEELADQAVLTCVDLDAVTAGVDRCAGGSCEAGDHGVDVLRLHPLGGLAGGHLRHT